MAIRERTAEGGRGKGEGHPDLEGEGRKDERALLLESSLLMLLPAAPASVSATASHISPIRSGGHQARACEGGDHEGRR
jgi:hypothetical protein